MNDTNTTYDTAVRDADFDDFADSATAVTSDASDADEIATTLAQWWQTNARDLPWRFGRTTPWGVLVSEVMSQQTQMGRVVRIGPHGWTDGRTQPRSPTPRNPT